MQADKERMICMREGVGTYASVMQSRELGFTRIFVEHPTLIVLRQGIKTIVSAGDSWTLHEHEAIVLTGGRGYDFTNDPDRHEAYAAQWLFWDSTLFADRVPPEALVSGNVKDAQPLGVVSAGLLSSFENARDALCQPNSFPLPIAQHRLAEMLVWLSMHGAKFLRPGKPLLSARVRRMIETEPANHWSIDSVAERFSVSGTSLRRHLAAEGTTLGKLLIETRMSLAVTLLQSTNAPIGNIALDLGYESSSRFSIRFRERFGFAPTAIRGHARRSAG